MKAVNGIYSFNSIIYEDTEWTDAEKQDEKPVYYKCKMLNGGSCYKCYKPSVAKIVKERGMFLKMEPIK